MPVRTLAGLLFLLGCLPLLAEDWPQFRGPGGRGISAAKGLPTVWSEQKNIRWKIDLPGRGLSSPVIAEGRLYLTACSGFEQKRLHVFCLDASSGKKLWERQFTATGTTLCHEKTNMAAPTPVTDGKHVFALFATHDLVGLDRDGNLLWFRSLTGDYPTVGNNVGMASSPILIGNTLVLALENAGESFALAIDGQTGQNRWRSPRQQGINWATPMPLGQTQVVLASPGEMSAHDVETGKKVWAFKGGKYSTIPSPAIVDGLIYAPGDKFQCIRPGSATEEAKLLWEARKLPGGYCSPLVYQGKVYMLGYKGILNCADVVTGAPLWNVRLDGAFSGSPIAAEGRIYAVSEEGTTYVVQASDGKIVATNVLPEKLLASPVASGGALYLRSDRALYCISAKK